MSWFKKIFKKEEKETLDKGLEKSRQGFVENDESRNRKI